MRLTLPALLLVLAIAALLAADFVTFAHFITAASWGTFVLLGA